MGKKTRLVIVPALMVSAACTWGARSFASDPGGPNAAPNAPEPSTLDIYRDWPLRVDRSNGPLEACFAPGTPTEVVKYVSDIVHVPPNGERYQLTGRWSPGAAGTPYSLTWSFVPDGLTISSGVGELESPSTLFATMDAKFATQGGRATWISRFEQIFARWSAVSGLTYTRITVGGNDWDDGAAWGSDFLAGQRGHLRISSHLIDGGNNVLAYNYFPQNGDMVIDSAENWGNQNNQNRFMRNILAHEHGHGMGLAHVCPAIGNILMEPFLTTEFDGPRHDDVRAANRQYGDVSGANSNAAGARLLTPANPGTTNYGAIPAPISGTSPDETTILSIDQNGEADWYKITVATQRVISVVAIPHGQSYQSCSQDNDCVPETCGSTTDSLNLADLRITVLNTNGVSVLGTANDNGVGVSESLNNVTLPSAGTYFVRIDEVNAPTGSQMYEFSVTLAAPCMAPDILPIPTQYASCGLNFSYTPSATGETPPYLWTLFNGPPGMMINSSTGEITWPDPDPSMSPYSAAVLAAAICGAGADLEEITVSVGYADFAPDGVITAADIPGMVARLLDGSLAAQDCSADLNTNGIVDGEDIAVFLDQLL